MIQEQWNLLEISVEEFNRWRELHPDVTIDLTNSDFSGMNLDEVNFSDALLMECNFTRARLIGARFDRANFSNSNFYQADCRFAIFDGAVGGSVNFYKARMNKVRMRMGWFDKSDFTGANLSYALFTDSSLNSAIFKGADTWGCRFSKVSLENVKFGFMDLQGCKISSPAGSLSGKIMARNMALNLLFLIAFLCIGYLLGNSYMEAEKKYGDLPKMTGSYFKFLLANTYYSSGRTQQAISLYKSAIKQRPDVAIYYYHLAIAYDQQGDIDRATENFEIYLRLCPDKEKKNNQYVEEYIQSKGKVLIPK